MSRQSGPRLPLRLPCISPVALVPRPTCSHSPLPTQWVYFSHPPLLLCRGQKAPGSAPESPLILMPTASTMAVYRSRSRQARQQPIASSMSIAPEHRRFGADSDASAVVLLPPKPKHSRQWTNPTLQLYGLRNDGQTAKPACAIRSSVAVAWASDAPRRARTPTHTQ